MSLEYIRRTYKVPAKRGMRVRFEGREGRITESKGSYLRVRFDGADHSVLLHPTYGVEYLDHPLKEQP